jgi:hypothetical protein
MQLAVASAAWATQRSDPDFTSQCHIPTVIGQQQHFYCAGKEKKDIEYHEERKESYGRKGVLESDQNQKQ